MAGHTFGSTAGPAARVIHLRAQNEVRRIVHKQRVAPIFFHEAGNRPLLRRRARLRERREGRKSEREPQTEDSSHFLAFSVGDFLTRRPSAERFWVRRSARRARGRTPGRAWRGRNGLGLQNRRRARVVAVGKQGEAVRRGIACAQTVLPSSGQERGRNRRPGRSAIAGQSSEADIGVIDRDHAEPARRGGRTLALGGLIGLNDHGGEAAGRAAGGAGGDGYALLGDREFDLEARILAALLNQARLSSVARDDAASDAQKGSGFFGAVGRPGGAVNAISTTRRLLRTMVRMERTFSADVRQRLFGVDQYVEKDLLQLTLERRGRRLVGGDQVDARMPEAFQSPSRNSIRSCSRVD